MLPSRGNTFMKPRHIKCNRGDAYLKPPYTGMCTQFLAMELVFSLLGSAFGLPIPSCGIMKIPALQAKKFSAPPVSEGHGFVSELVNADPWNGDGRDLRSIRNVDDISRLVVYDTWIFNRDRYSAISPLPNRFGPHQNFANVIVSGPLGTRKRLHSIDFGHAVTYGAPIDATILSDRVVKSKELLGLFDGFKEHIRRDATERAIADMKQLKPDQVRRIVSVVPDEWWLSPNDPRILADFICARADFVSTIIMSVLEQEGLQQLSLGGP